MSDTPIQRICPVCGELTQAAFCPKEGASTVVSKAFSKHPRNYAVDDLVAERYRITGALGSGGYAAVYSAEHTGTGQQVAVKLMAFDPTSDGGEVAVRRFFREARITAGLLHPNTVRVFDVGQDDGGAFYIAMELLRGESLEELLKRVLRAGEALTVDDALEIMIPVLDSLAEAHGQQMVHRDLKPANIFLLTGPNGERIPKVLDFGIARTHDSSLTVGRTIPGTPPFMSPEQCRGEPLDGRSDLYSLAVLLFLCVVGRLPYHDTNVLRLMRMHAFDPPPDPRSKTDRPLPDGLVDILMRSLAKSPDDRPADAGAMREELQAIRDGHWLPHELDGETEAAVMAIGADEPGRETGLAVAGAGAASTPAAPAETVTPAPTPAPAAALVTPASVPAASPDDVTAAASVTQASPVLSVQAPEPTPPRALSRGLLWIGVAVLLIGGVSVGVLLGRRGPSAATAGQRAAAPAAVAAPSQPGLPSAAMQAKVVLSMAEKAADPARKLDYARDALRLDPNNKAAAALVAALRAAAVTGSDVNPAPSPAASALAPTAPPAAAAAAAAAAAVAAPAAVGAPAAAPAAVAAPAAAPAAAAPAPAASAAPAAARPVADRKPTAKPRPAKVAPRPAKASRPGDEVAPAFME